MSDVQAAAVTDEELARATQRVVRMREEVRRISPGDVAGYDTFMAESERIYRIGFEQLGHVPFGSPLDMLKIAPDLLRLGAWRTVHQHVGCTGVAQCVW